MRVSIAAWDSRPIEIGPRHALRGEAMRFDTAALALQLLRRAVDPGDLLRLRALLVAQHGAIYRIDDDEVLRRVAAQLDAGTLVAVLSRAVACGLLEGRGLGCGIPRGARRGLVGRGDRIRLERDSRQRSRQRGPHGLLRDGAASSTARWRPRWPRRRPTSSSCSASTR